MYQDKIILITGTSRGIGAALRDHVLEQGATVYGCSRHDIPFCHPHYHHTAMDITIEAAIIRLIKQINREQGRLDLLINNAGIASMNHSLLTPGSTAQTLIATNFIAAFNFCREGAKLMKKHHTGRIINLISVAVPYLIEGEALYAASKSALLTFSQIFAKEIAPFGVTCNCIGPGPVQTDLIQHIPPEKIQRLLDQLPSKRFTTMARIITEIDRYAQATAEVNGQITYLE